MTPPKSALAESRPALAPQRRPGIERVAALLQAGAQVIAERGFEAATMAEIAARAEAPIGSLYRFFPSKDAIGSALIDRYIDLIDAAFEQIEHRSDLISTEALADALLDSLMALRGETQSAIIALLDARAEFSERRSEFTESIRRNILRAITLRDPKLDPEKAQNMSAVLLQNCKAMKMLDPVADAGVIGELRAMTRLYLVSQLR